MQLESTCLRSAHLVTVLVLLSLMGCSSQQSADAHRKKADGYMQAGDYDRARIEYLNVLRSAPSDPEAVRQLGVLYEEQGALLSAAPFLTKAAELEPTNADVRARLGKVYLTFGETTKAREEALVALEADPNNPNAILLFVQIPGSEQDLSNTVAVLNGFRTQATNKALYRVTDAMIAFRKNDLAAAQSSVQEAIEIDALLADAHLLRGELFEMQTNLAAADEELKLAAELSPVRSIRRVRYAEFKLRQGETEAAKALLAAQVKEAPDYLPALSAQARLAFAERKLDEALALCNTLLDRYAYQLDASLLRAQIRLLKGESAKGMEELQRIEQVFGRLPQYRFQMAMLQMANQEPNKAMAALEQIVQTTPNYAEAVLLLARMNLQRGRATQAIQGLLSFLELQPENQAAHRVLADAYVVDRQYDQALEIYRNYANQHPSDPRGPFFVGLVLLQQKQLEEARKEFEHVLSIKPDFLPAAVQLVTLDMGAGQLESALNRAQNLVERLPESAGALSLLARVQLAQDNATAAEASLKKAIELDPGATPAYYLLANIYKEQQQLRPALEQVDRLLKTDPGDQRALMLSAIIHSELGEHARTAEAYEALVASSPNFWPALNNLACLYADRLPDLDKAWRYARRARELEPESPQTADTLGWVHFKRGDYPDAVRLLSESTEGLPAEPEVQYHLGMAHYMMAQEAAARSAFERAVATEQDYEGKAEAQRRLELLTFDSRTGTVDAQSRLEAQLKQEPHDVIALARLARIRIAGGDLRGAQSTLESALTANPNLPEALITLAELKAEDGQQEEALRLVRRARDAASGDGEVVWRGGRVAMKCQDSVFALGLLKEAARRSGDRPDILVDLAGATYGTGNLDEANNLCRRALQANPLEPALTQARQLQWLIEVYRNPGTAASDSEARITALLKQSPGSIPAEMALASVLAQTGRYEAARDLYQSILKQSSGFPQAHRELALLYARPDRLNDPVQAYDHAVEARRELVGDAQLTKILGILTYQRGDVRYAEQLLREAARTLPQDPEILELLQKGQGN